MSGAGSLMDSSQSAARTGAMVNARNGVVNDNMNRNNGLATQANAALQPAVAAGGQPGMDAARDQSVADRIAAIPTGPTNGINVGGAPKAVSDEIGRVGKVVSDAVQRNAVAKANLAGYGDAQTSFANTSRGAGDKIGTFSNFAHGNTAILPAEISSAENNAASAYNSPLGGILKGIGGLTAAAGSLQGADGSSMMDGLYNSGGPLGGGFQGPKAPGFFNRIGF